MSKERKSSNSSNDSFTSDDSQVTHNKITEPNINEEQEAAQIDSKNKRASTLRLEAPGLLDKERLLSV